MRVMAQVGMVMNLDKCIGCHTCWSPARSVDEPRRRRVHVVQQRRDQARDRLPEALGGPGAVERRLGARPEGPAAAEGRRPAAQAAANIFSNPDLPELDDYYEPWTYDYEQLTNAGPVRASTRGPPESQRHRRAHGHRMGPELGGRPRRRPGDRAPGPEPARASRTQVKMEYERVFMMYLPRICEHCLNPCCVASCPSGAMYKREEDGIVLVDQERCRGWRMCVSGCPYKKVYFNRHTRQGREVHALLPAHRGRDADGLLGDLRRAASATSASSSTTPTACEAAATPGPASDLLDAQLAVFLDPRDPEVMPQRRGAKASRRTGSTPPSARRSGSSRWSYRVALPLHPEYRTLPMVWYVPPLSPVMGMIEGEGSPGRPRRRLPGHRRAAHPGPVPGEPAGGRR